MLLASRIVLVLNLLTDRGLPEDRNGKNVFSTDVSLPLDEVMARHIRAILDQVYWKVTGKGGAAEILGLKPSTLRFRMKKLGIEKKN